jgi:hypothetical protein
MRTAVKLRITDGDRSVEIPQATEWQRVGGEIDSAMIFARSDLVNVRWLHRMVRPYSIHLTLTAIAIVGAGIACA